MQLFGLSETQIVGVAIAAFVLAVTVAIVFSSKKSKGSTITNKIDIHMMSKPKPSSVLGLPFRELISCSLLNRKSQLSLDSDVGHFKLVITVMSHHFHVMRVDDYMSVKRPKGRLKYQPGQVSVRALGMLAGGSGITPMFQVARAVLENLNDTTKVHLIYANVCLEDMLLKEEIDRLASNYPDHFKVYSCGSPLMNKAMDANLEALGYAPETQFQF
ncbi:hypothetical protein DCAR_0519383 [Daucus carota subsp. sativus]|uniref:cytochrome-b5 reductase n=1 Tax=Daucus carota subsp. sativus TaxID=79200 RepID=A0AAF0X3T5_DAUCS|nr:hypothetical protein DCAR_0519383 [Daucus carota subsp. sativus]